MWLWLAVTFTSGLALASLLWWQLAIFYQHQKFDSLSNEELLAIVLGSGIRDISAKGLAERIICQSSMGLRFLTECVPEELTEIKGIGIAKTCKIGRAHV